MPSRRSVLASAAMLASAGCAGCLGRAEPDWRAWLYSPPFPAPNYGFVSLDTDELRAHEDALPEEWVRASDRTDRQFDTLAAEDIERVTAVLYEDEGPRRMGGSVALAGVFDPDAVIREFAAGSSVREVDPVEGHRLFAYRPTAIGPLVAERLGVDAPLTTAFAVGERTLVGGAMLDRETEATAAVREMVGKRGEATTPAHADGLGTVLGAFGRDPAFGQPALVAGVSLESWDAVAARVPDTWPTLRQLVDDLRALGLGVSFVGETTLTDFVLVYDPETVFDVENVRAVAEKLREEEQTGDRGIVDVALTPDGRGVRVWTTVDLHKLWADYGHLFSLAGT
jgi:hypothetical protein